MAQIQRSLATLRIMGNNLDPTEITRLLGCAPDAAQTRGEEIAARSGGSVRIARKAMWRLSATDGEPEDLDAQIRELLSKLTDDLTVWASIAERHRVDLFCGLFMREGNEGLSITPGR